AGKENIGKGGIVKDVDGKIKALVMEKITRIASENGLKLIKTAVSPILGGDGNTEYLALFERSV
ncbi:MAG: TlyA family RNA methyltransferase, partial [Clostridia bacterium]|nr:TlyA family RNA methyltransferase [Clostridia bacterium]